MKNVLKCFIAIIICEGVGGVSALFTISAIPTWYAFLHKPFFAPPNWVFGPVWNTLYFLMGVSVFLVWQKGVKNKNVKEAVSIFAIQLGLNFLWSIIFFGLRAPAWAFIDIVLLWVAIMLSIKRFYPISKTAAYLLVPYLLWVSFATILNLAIVLLNS